MIDAPVRPGTTAQAVTAPRAGAATDGRRPSRVAWKFLGLVASATAFLAVLGLFARWTAIISIVMWTIALLFSLVGL